MAVRRKFAIRASISSAAPRDLRPVLERLVSGTIKATPDGFQVEGTMEGPSARDLNRSLLTELRRVERRTRLRSTWTSGEVVERFFDYVPKRASHSAP